jgi:hypothetical protein
MDASSKVVGEGVDGCITENPVWPCASETQTYGNADSGYTSGVISKIIQNKAGDESENLRIATKIVGPRDSLLYLAGLRGQCKPANDTHPPSANKYDDYAKSKKALMEFEGTDGLACGKLKGALTSKSGITDTHKLLLISKYPITFSEWIVDIKRNRVPFSAVTGQLTTAIPKLLDILQKFYRNHTEHLVNFDLHKANLFVRTQGGENLILGIADFGRCLHRRVDQPQALGKFAFDYLLTNHYKYKTYVGFKQIPFEARILNYCLKHMLENSSPEDLIRAWVNNSENVEYSSLREIHNDIIAVNKNTYMKRLLRQPLFIEMLETLQSIVKKMRAEPTLMTSMTSDEIVVLEYIATRYMAVSPMVVILDQLVFVKPDVHPMIEQITEHSEMPTDIYRQLYPFVEYINRLILAPYVSMGKGSSLSVALASVRNVDVAALWADIVAGN